MQTVVGSGSAFWKTIKRRCHIATREEVLRKNKKYRVSDNMKETIRKRGFSFKINYSSKDECYYITLYDKCKHEETYYKEKISGLWVRQATITVENEWNGTVNWTYTDEG